MKTMLFLIVSLMPGLASAAEQQPKKPPEVLKPSQANACAKYGEGWVQVKGSDTCVKLGGYVRIDAAH